MILFDAGILIKLFSKKASEDKQRLDYLVQTLGKSKDRIIIPTPALAEYLVKAGDTGGAVLDELKKSGVFRVVPFHQKAAIECAFAIKRDMDKGDKRGGAQATWAKAKFDRQIVAIAKAEGAARIYTEDSDVKLYSVQAGIKAESIADLPLPPEAKQGKLKLDEPNDQ